MCAGLVLGAKLLASPVYIKGVALSLDTLIYSVTMIEVGFQAILFALLSRAYAVQEGLFPKSKRTLFDRIFTLERGIILGAVLIALGLGLFLYAFSIWGNANFGPLDVQKVTPIVIGSSISLVFGVRDHPLELLVEHVEAERQNHVDDAIERRRTRKRTRRRRRPLTIAAFWNAGLPESRSGASERAQQRKAHALRASPEELTIRRRYWFSIDAAIGAALSAI